MFSGGRKQAKEGAHRGWKHPVVGRIVITDRSFFASGEFFAIRLDAGGIITMCSRPPKIPAHHSIAFLIIAT